MRKFFIVLLVFCTLPAAAQVDRHDVRAGNRKFRKDEFKEAEINYRKAVLKDSLSVAGEYNLASTLYRQEDFEGAGKALETVKDVAAVSPNSTRYFYNLGDVALQKKDYGAAMEAFKQALLRDPSDMDAKENYIYAKLMKQDEDQNGGGGQDNDQNKDNDQNNDQDQNGGDDQDKNQNQDQNQNGDKPQDQNPQNQPQQQQPQDQKISPQQAQQMLQAIQAKEKETQDKVKKEKAELLQSRQKEKNW
ncbi:MAG: tetratricopeptide repeat protein [Bacteroidales bacterium]|nr:tetratricopeptide repeat protein [Bacteroidales bacterium]